MRIHYFCAGHWRALEHGADVEMTSKSLGRKCCWCKRRAEHRATTRVAAPCPPGHIARKRFERLLNEAYGAAAKEALAESPLPGLGVGHRDLKPSKRRQ